ncbi:MAG: response regulator, partial [Clostridia bacterium]
MEYLTALNGLDALELLKREPFDVLFTDIKMPFMDGLALSREAKALNPQLRIILFSGYNDFEYAKTAIAIGVTEYLMKPIIPDEFLHTMEGVLHAIEKQRM